MPYLYISNIDALVKTLLWTEADKKDAVKRSLDDKYNKNRSRDEAKNTMYLSGTESGWKVKHISTHRCYIWHCRRHVSTLYRKENHYISVVLSVSFFSTWNTLVINAIIRNNLHRSKRKHCCNDFLKTERNILLGILLTNWNMTLEEISAW